MDKIFKKSQSQQVTDRTAIENILKGQLLWINAI